MKQVLRALRLFPAAVTVVAILAATSALMAAVSTGADLPPCAAGRVVNFGTLSLRDCTISGNSTADPGGGVENYGDLELTNVVISGNTSASGGGIYNGLGASLTLTNVLISGNVADDVGGGIYNDGGTVYMSDVTITQNTSGAGGGGLANFSGSTIGANVAVIGNETLAGDGGGILNDSTVCLTAGTDFGACSTSPAGGDSLVRDNRAAGNGGGIANLSGGTFTMSDSTVDRNRAEAGSGGGVWNGSTTQLSSVTISNNNATGDGGGLFNGEFGSLCCSASGVQTATNLTIAHNHADGNGGGVYTTNFAFTGLSSSTIADNTADGAGGGANNDDDGGAFTELQDTLLARNGANCSGTMYSLGHNLDTGFTCGFSEATDQSDVTDAEVGLGVLAANDGPVQGSSVVFDRLMTLALDVASPAVDAGSDSCPAADERGVTRPQGTACDIGAFELEAGGSADGTTMVTATITAANKIYDATMAATVTGCTLSSARALDGVSCVANDGVFDTANVGTGKTVTATVTLTGASAGSYKLSSSSAMTTADITSAPASVTPISRAKTYGTSDPALTGTLSGFLAVDQVTATYIRASGETVAGGPYAITATLSPTAALANYTVTYNTASFTITKAIASVMPNAATKVYGSADPALSGTLSGFSAADGVIASYSRAAGETVAGGPYAITATLSPTAALANYTVAYNTASFTITRAIASVTPNAATKVYGSADPALSGTLSGFSAADGVTASYSRAAGETVAGGPYPITATLSPASALDNYTVTYNTASFTITKAIASVTPNAATKTFGSADPALSGTLSGFSAADGVTASYSRAAGETVAGGPYAITATLSPASALDNYTVAYNTASFTITKAIASVTPNAGTKSYGATDPALTGTLLGFSAVDGVIASYSRAAGETVAGGPYPITATLSPTAALANYTVTYNMASFTITKATASVTPNAATKVYGSADPALSGTLSGFSAADGVIASYSRAAGETVAGGPYAITATLSPTAALANYTVTYNTASFTITKAIASVTPNAGTKSYGATDPALTGTLSGFSAVDGVIASYSRAAGETVAGGPYPITATLSPTAALANYTVAYNTASFTITKAIASVTPNAATKVYGSADPALSGTLSGFSAANGVTASYSRAAGETVAGGPYPITATLSPANALDNYTVTYNTASFTITKAIASVTPNAATKVYGSADPALSGTLSGFSAADGVTASYSRAAGETVAGGPYAITATLSPAAALANYTVTYNTASFTITKAIASVTPNAGTKSYGATDPALTGTLSGFSAADGVTASYSRAAGETVAGGPYAITATLSPASALDNYTVTYNTASFTITKANASVTPNAATKVYGSADPALGGTLSGFSAADGVIASYSRAAGETAAGGPYAITATLSPAAALANYTVTYNTASFTITKAIASVTPNAATKSYGVADPALSGTLSGFNAADGVIASYSRAAGETVAGGPYAITATLNPAAALANYTVTYNTASFTITKAIASVTPNAATKTFGSADPALSGTLSGFSAADGVIASYSRAAGETVAGGPYAITATLSPAAALANYTVTYNTASFTITKAIASVTPNAATKSYGAADPALSGTLSGFRSADGVTAAYSRTPGETVAGSPYTISAILSPAGALANYTVTYNTAGFTITAAIPSAALTLTKTANPMTYAYAGQTIVYTYVVQNTGGVTVSGPFMISDDKLGSFQCGTATTLAPTVSINCTKSYVVQANDLGTVPSLPTGVVANVNTGAWLQGVMSTQDTTISNAAGVPNGIYPAWCIQDHVPNDLHNQPGRLYSTVGSNLPADVAGLAWNKINYVLNHKIRGTGRTDLQFLEDVQTAVWLLLGEQNPDFGKSTWALQMVANANANPNFVPGQGDTVAVIVYSDGMGTSQSSIQESIIELKPFQQITNHASATGKVAGATLQSNMAQATVTQTANAAPVDVAAHGDQCPAKNSVTTTVFSTTGGNRLLLAFVAADNTTSTNTTVTSVIGAGLTWQLVVRANAQRGTSEIWRAFAPSTLTNVTVTANLSQSVESMLTVLALTGVDTTGTNGSGAIGRTATSSAASGAPTVTLTTTRANSWIFAVGNDWDNAIARTAGPNQVLVHQYLAQVGDTYWVQRLLNQTASIGSTVTINDVGPTSDRWNLAVVEIKVP